jgi:hypothetical protein
MTYLLWPDEVSEVGIDAPIAILQEQASLLGKNTSHVVEAKISRSEIYIPSKKHGFRYDFSLYAPILRNYVYYLFSTTHHYTDWYPVIFHLDDEKMRKELSSKLGEWQGNLTASSEEEFCTILSAIFQSKKTEGVIARIIAQSKQY